MLNGFKEFYSLNEGYITGSLAKVIFRQSRSYNASRLFALSLLLLKQANLTDILLN